ncbi:MAG: serine/threonine-protein kinase [Pirellulales bacterium]
MIKKSEPSSSAETLDTAITDLSSNLRPACHHVGFMEGSRPQLATETASVLRNRLRAAAGVLFMAFGAFFVWRLTNPADLSTGDSFTFYAHFAVTVVLGGALVLLCRTCAIHLKILRVYELIIFGMPAAYFLVHQYDSAAELTKYGILVSPLPYWLGLVFTYGMFIPNTWRRAAVVVGTMCLLPILLTGVLVWINPEYAAALRKHPGIMTDMVIMLGVACVSCVYGTHMINTLRSEAFEAKLLGQYRLCRPIGAGGMGEVYLAEHQMMKRPVAIKLIRPSKAADPQALARFEREVRATAKLSHWNSIEIFDYGRSEDGTFYYVMEYLPGMSLSELVERHGPLPPARAIHLLAQTCDALSEAHAQGLIHRDIKPGNIFSAYRGGTHDVAKLLDFGLAKPISAETESIQLTQEGSITGSPLFMSPEQALGDSEPDARSDIYSMGAVAYYLLTGAPPFDGDKPMRVILAHAHEPVVPPSHLRSDIPADLEAVVLKCLAKNPAERYASAAALREALGDCVAAGGWSSADAAGWWQSHGSADVQAEALASAEF